VKQSTTMTAEAKAQPAALRLRDLRSWTGSDWLLWLRDFTVLVVGLFLFSGSLSLSLQSNLGANSWTVLHDGIAKQTPLSIGQASQVVGLLMIGVSWLVGIRPGIGTVMNMFLVGFFMDQILASGVIPLAGPYPARVMMLVVSVLGMGMASGMYIRAGLGAGPRDSFMLALTRMTGWPVGINRWAIEAGVVIVGALFGGAFGVGTILFAILVGPSTDFGFRLFGLTPRKKRSTPWPWLSRDKGKRE
jgi:uncharacterized membrane protein YczE